MLNRESQSNKSTPRKKAFCAAALIAVLATLAAAIFYIGGVGFLTLRNQKTGEMIAKYPVRIGDGFSVGFIHSVNKSPLTDYYEIKKDGIYVWKTVYYGFGAGVQTELEGNEKLEYGEDGSMIVTGFDQRMDHLVYCVGTVSDHTLTLTGTGEEISLRNLCGRNTLVKFSYEPLIHF